MTTYEDLHWDSLRLVKKHLYRRLATPLNNALGRLAIARHVSDPAEAREQYRRVEHNLEIALNLVKAWAALIHVMSGGKIRQGQRRTLNANDFPAWLIENLNTQTAFLIEHAQPITIHPETFYESLLLMCSIGAGVGTLKKLTTGDAPNDDTQVWIRAIFEPPSSGPYESLRELYQRVSTPTAADQELTFQLKVLQELCHINSATLRLQNNRRTGEQALGISVPTAVQRAEPVITHEEAAADEPQETMVAFLMHGLAVQPANGKQKTAEEIENFPDTHILVPPPDFRERMAAQLKESTTEALEDAIENASETMIVPPPNFREQLLARTKEIEQAAGIDMESDAKTHADNPPAENKSETLIVPPPNFRERLAQQLDAESKPDTEAPEPRRPGTGPFNRPPGPGVIEIVEPENASETLIVPPPDYRRRLGLSHPTTRPNNHYAYPTGDEKLDEPDKSAPAE